uniref:Uncharacterized protein n=1 Tax=Anguilla anguilla TaxID=7936 RepID=A0A0E9WR40_ANGAN
MLSPQPQPRLDEFFMAQVEVYGRFLKMLNTTAQWPVFQPSGIFFHGFNPDEYWIC